MCYVMSSSRVVGSGTNTVRFGEKPSEETVKTVVLQITVLVGVGCPALIDLGLLGSLSGLVARGGRTGLCPPLGIHGKERERCGGVR